MREYKPLYIWSLEHAKECDETARWRESFWENCNCAKDIEQAIAGAYKDNLMGDCAPAIIEKYGFERVNWVLSNSLQYIKGDGRISDANNKWAEQTYIQKDMSNAHYAVQSHPGLLNLFVDQARKAWQDLNLYDISHCVDFGNEGMDLKERVCIIKPTTLKDQYKKPEFQLFYAASGFGCSPNASGRKVFGTFLVDGENTSFIRSDFLGVIKEEHLPDWAKEKVEEITGKKYTVFPENNEMGGMQ